MSEKLLDTKTYKVHGAFGWVFALQQLLPEQNLLEHVKGDSY